VENKGKQEKQDLKETASDSRAAAFQSLCADMHSTTP
jgi:hypothetical protein